MGAKNIIDTEQPGFRNIFAIKNLSLPVHVNNTPILKPKEKIKRRKPKLRLKKRVLKRRSLPELKKHSTATQYGKIRPFRIVYFKRADNFEVRNLFISKKVFHEIRQIQETTGYSRATVFVNLIIRGLDSYDKDKFIFENPTKEVLNIKRDLRPRLGEE